MRSPSPLRRSPRRLPFFPCVEQLETRDLPSTLFTVTTTADDSDIGLSLRQAIQLANRTKGPVVIQFQIPGAASQVFTIAPFSPLPAIDNEVLIDGTSQQAFNGGTIELNGSNLSDEIGNGLTINAPNCTVQGLVIDDFAAAGIFVGFAASNCVIQGNTIGTDTTGTTSAGNRYGVEVFGPGNTIGGVTPDARNVLSGNQDSGVFISGPGAIDNVVEGNFIGTTADGLAALPNGSGVTLGNAAAQNTIGGITSAAANLISGNDGPGVSIVQNGESRRPFQDTIAGNLIGTDVSGTQALGNGGDGVLLQNTNDDTIAGNVIASNGGNGVLIRENSDFSSSFSDENRVQGNFIGTDLSETLSLPNQGDGVQVDGSSGNQVLGNSIFLNGGIGIDLVNDGNNLQPSPSIDAVTIAGNSVQIAWSLLSPDTPSTPFDVEFFSSSAADPNGPGPGQHFLTAVDTKTDESGQASGTLVLNSLSASEPYLTATATDLNGSNTSQFSAAVVLPLADLAVSTTVDDAAPLVGQVIHYTVTVTNNGGPDDATGVSLANVLPTGLSFMSAQASQGSYDGGTWTVGDLAVNASATLAIVASVQPGTANTRLSDQAIVTVSDQLDPNPANNQAQVSITPVIASFQQVVQGTMPPPLTAAPLASPVQAPSVEVLAATVPELTIEVPAVPTPPLLPSAELAQVLDSDNFEIASAVEKTVAELPPEQVAAVITLLFAPPASPRPNLDTLAEPPARKEAQTGMITGAVFVDVNADGVWQVGEPPLEGMRVYLDLTGTGTFDANKPLAVTDSDGQYRFDGLAPGLYTVRLVPHPLYAVTAPLGGLAQVHVEAGMKASVTFGCKPLRPRHDNEDARSRPRLAPSSTSRGDARFEARDALFSSGESMPWLSGAALVGFIAGGTQRRRSPLAAKYVG